MRDESSANDLRILLDILPDRRYLQELCDIFMTEISDIFYVITRATLNERIIRTEQLRGHLGSLGNEQDVIKAKDEMMVMVALCGV
jgi:hypothetical protein